MVTAEQIVNAFMDSDFLETLICMRLHNSIEVTEALIREYEERPYNPLELQDIARWKQELVHLRAVLHYYTGSYQ
jgi:hypothetical protein